MLVDRERFQILTDEQTTLDICNEKLRLLFAIKYKHGRDSLLWMPSVLNLRDEDNFALYLLYCDSTDILRKGLDDMLCDADSYGSFQRCDWNKFVHGHVRDSTIHTDSKVNIYEFLNHCHNANLLLPTLQKALALSKSGETRYCYVCFVVQSAVALQEDYITAMVLLETGFPREYQMTEVMHLNLDRKETKELGLLIPAFPLVDSDTYKCNKIIFPNRETAIEQKRKHKESETKNAPLFRDDTDGSGAMEPCCQFCFTERPRFVTTETAISLTSTIITASESAAVDASRNSLPGAKNQYVYRKRSFQEKKLLFSMCKLPEGVSAESWTRMRAAYMSAVYSNSKQFSYSFGDAATRCEHCGKNEIKAGEENVKAAFGIETTGEGSTYLDVGSSITKDYKSNAGVAGVADNAITSATRKPSRHARRAISNSLKRAGKKAEKPQQKLQQQQQRQQKQENPFASHLAPPTPIPSWSRPSFRHAQEHRDLETQENVAIINQAVKHYAVVADEWSRKNRFRDWEGEVWETKVLSNELKPFPALFACARCKWVRYCSKQCQTADWEAETSSHKALCPYFAELYHFFIRNAANPKF